MNPDTPDHAPAPALPVCPGCGSTSVQAVTDRGQTYSPGLGLLGCLFAPGLGLLAGFLGATPDRTQILCLACGKRFAPARLRSAKRSAPARPGLSTGPLLVVGSVFCIAGIFMVLALTHWPSPAPAGPAVPLVSSAPAAPPTPESIPEPALPAPIFEPPPTPELGMTLDQVTALLGPPASTSGATVHGLRHDMWFYPGGKRLYFAAGTLRLLTVNRPSTTSITPNH